MSHRDNVFGGSVAELYEAGMVPMIFEPYAVDLVRRVRELAPPRLLEIGAGTGVVTRALAVALPPSTAIVATDLNPAMLQRAALAGIAREVEWRVADAAQLPFADGSFDVVISQFAAMFFPDKPKAFAEVRRVLRPAGTFVFSVWDRLSDNEFAETVDAAVAALFPGDAPRFMARTPHGYYARERIARDLADGGFTATPRIEVVAARSRAPSAGAAAVAFCQGTPLRTEIESRDAARLQEGTAAAAAALAARFGSGAIEGHMQACVITIDR
jgi:SAM-dependent methyltransferase